MGRACPPPPPPFPPFPPHPEGCASRDEVQPWYRLGGVEHICELRKGAQVLYSIFVTILRMMYSDRGGRTFGCPDVVWRKDPQKTGLWIDTELRWEDQRPDFTPAIYVGLGEISYTYDPTLGMDARTFLSHDGETSYQRTAAGTASLIHVCDRAGAACSLADNTENCLSMLQDSICGEYCFDRLAVAGRLPRQKPEQPQTAGKGRYFSVVSVQFEFTDAWKVKNETPILRAVSPMDRGGAGVKVAGTGVDAMDGRVELEFGDIATETDAPRG